MLKDWYSKMVEIRIFEERILALFSENKVSGTTHTYIGQEATAVAAMYHITEKDKVFSNHRCHGHFLAYGGSKTDLLAEIMTKSNGVCCGKGGSQHLHYKNFYTNGIQGGIVPNALGMSWADKIKGNDAITVVFLGDGTLGQGVVYEAFNIAALFSIPILFVIENNRYAMSTKVEKAVSGTILRRPEAFGVKASEVESTDVEELISVFEKAYSYVRSEKKPFVQIVHNYRLAAHSKGDDYRDRSEILAFSKKDPLRTAEKKLEPKSCLEIKEKQKIEMEKAVLAAERMGSIEIKIQNDVKKEENKNSCLNTEEVLCVESIRRGLDNILRLNEKTLLLGEDIEDDYGGAFKVTKGLSRKYPNRVINMPISEQGIIGSGVGMAMNGIIPIIEIMFGDFLTLGFDQILNHALKYGWVYQEVQVPIIIRTPMGAGRGYGPTHSQSLEKFFIGMPFLQIVALSILFNPEELYQAIFKSIKGPVLVIENKTLYAKKLFICKNNRAQDFYIEEIYNECFPSAYLTLDKSAEPDLLIITYGGMTVPALTAAKELLVKDELLANVLLVTQLSPVPLNDLKEVAGRTDKVVVVEEGTKTLGWGAEIICCLTENNLGKQYLRIATPDLPIPNGCILEKQIIPNSGTITERIRRFYYEERN